MPAGKYSSLGCTAKGEKIMPINSIENITIELDNHLSP